jgi:hypothetical protein
MPRGSPSATAKRGLLLVLSVPSVLSVFSALSALTRT